MTKSYQAQNRGKVIKLLPIMQEKTNQPDSQAIRVLKNGRIAMPVAKNRLTEIESALQSHNTRTKRKSLILCHVLKSTSAS